MDTRTDTTLLKQHLIDPAICIRCGACEAACPIQAISHDANNYVVDPSICEQCLACIPGCPTGAIDNWRLVPKARAYALDEQFGWFDLPEELTPAQLAEFGVDAPGDDGAAAEAPQRMQMAGSIRCCLSSVVSVRVSMILPRPIDSSTGRNTGRRGRKKEDQKCL